MFKLLPEDQRKPMAELLRLVDDGEEFNYEKAMQKLKDRCDKKQKSVVNDIKSLI